MLIRDDEKAPEDITGWITVHAYARRAGVEPATIYRKLGLLSTRTVAGVRLVHASCALPRRRRPRVTWCDEAPPKGINVVYVAHDGQISMGQAPPGVPWLHGSQGIIHRQSILDI
jgi:hypothetical protein